MHRVNSLYPSAIYDDCIIMVSVSPIDIFNEVESHVKQTVFPWIMHDIVHAQHRKLNYVVGHETKRKLTQKVRAHRRSFLAPTVFVGSV